MTQRINLTAGATEYTWPVTITETNGADISGGLVQIALGSYTDPGPWRIPDVITRPTPSSATVKMLLGNGAPTAGTYYVWVRVTDTPEVVPRRAHRVEVTGTSATGPPTPTSSARTTSTTLAPSPTLVTAA